MNCFQHKPLLIVRSGKITLRVAYELALIDISWQEWELYLYHPRSMLAPTQFH